MIPVGKTYIEIYFHSADKEDSLRGQGLDGLVVDEAGFLKRGRWATELRPSLSDKKGWAILIGTPKGRNEFYTFYVRGQDPEYANWMSWSFSSYVNTLPNGGYIEWSEIEALRDELPELIYRQEILAEFLEGEGVVFRNVDLSADPTLTRAREKCQKNYHKPKYPSYFKCANADNPNMITCKVCEKNTHNKKYDMCAHCYKKERTKKRKKTRKR